MSFLFPSLVSGAALLLIGVPALIHLINLIRHRRVKWAAMDFLMQSQKKNRRWILLRQFLLLFLRMIAVASILLMLAQPVLHSRWGALFGGTKTHHMVLVDDSYSMSDQWEEADAFDHAKLVVQRLAERASEHEGTQRISLLRFSRSGDRENGSQFELIDEAINQELIVKIETLLGTMVTSQTDAGPTPALEAILRQPSRSDDENRIVYLVSDFRQKDWNSDGPLRKALDEAHQAGIQIHLVHCVPESHDNLVLSALQPAAGTPAAGVEMLMELQVTNFGEVAAQQVSVQLEEDGQVRPSIVIERIEPGESVSRQFRVNFPTAGSHTLTAALPGDAVRVDNYRYCVLDLSHEMPVLVVDGDSAARDAYFLASALAPGGKAVTGLKPQIETPRYLKNHETLARYSVIYLLNLRRLDDSEIAAVEAYVRSGGSVVFALGERSSASFFNDKLYRNREGLFPVPLDVATDLLVDREHSSPDLVVARHPIFHVFSGERNSFLNKVRVQRYFAVAKDWEPPSDSSTKIAAELRNGAPFVVEKHFGEGRVVCILSKLSPETTSSGSWNDWARSNPSFVVTMLETQAYLSRRAGADHARLVGQPLQVEFDPRLYEGQIRFKIPSSRSSSGSVVNANLPANPQENAERGVETDGGTDLETDAKTDANTNEVTDRAIAVFPDTDSSGVYEAALTSSEGELEIRSYAYNVVPDEGSLRSLNEAELASQLDGIPHEFHHAKEIEEHAQDLAGFNFSDALLYAVIALLCGEQLLAYWASYHPHPGGR